MKNILDFIYPHELSCMLCKKKAEGMGENEICGHCMSMMPFIGDNTCIRCGRPINSEYEGSICKECSSDIIYFDNACPVFEFSGLAQAALYRLKYDGDIDIAPAIGRIMADKIKERKWDIDIVIPVPLHKDRLNERGYNQSLLLASEIGRELGIDVQDGILKRERYTESQVTLSRLQRIHNVRRAFAASDSALIKGRKFLIVDDIMTTGATLNECSRILKECQAKKVYCVTAACPL